MISLPPPDSRLRFVVAIPARNEEATIERTLAALAGQLDGSGRPLERGACEALVFANGCSDATAARARAFAARDGRMTVHVAEGTLPSEHAHVGMARRLVMEEASRRLLRAGCPDGTVATTDGDTAVHPQWIAQTERVLATADAVGGRIAPDPAEWQNLPFATREGLALEERYRFAVARLESACDPLAHDPWPRHGQQFAASFAVRATSYRRVGGLPPRPFLEDVALYGALLAVDARFCHSLRVRVTTSARTDSRASGGFGTHLAMLEALYGRGRSQHVEDADLTIARVRARAAFRRFWNEGPALAGETAERAAWAPFRIAAEDVRRTLLAASHFGAAFQILEREAEARGAFRTAPMPVRLATARLEAAVRGEAAARLAEPIPVQQAPAA